MAQKEMRIDKPYLNLPVRPDAPIAWVNWERPDGGLLYELYAELDFDDPAYYVPCHVERWMGETLRLRIDAVSEERLEALVCEDKPRTWTKRPDDGRPRVHFTPFRGVMGDPNGLFALDGAYHAFYQHNPYGTQCGDWTETCNFGWSPAVSTDLCRWRGGPPFMIPDENGPAFSGTAFVDEENASGLGDGTKPPVLLYYTAAGGQSRRTKGGAATQRLMVSIDGGEHFHPYAHNPILPNFCRGNRDPKVFRHRDSGRYILVIYSGEKYLYYVCASTDLLHWERLPDFQWSDWECPDVMEVPVEGEDRTQLVFWSARGYWAPVDFDGERFTQLAPARPFDEGHQIQCGQSFAGMKGRCVQLHRFNVGLPGAPWYGAYTLPYELTLAAGPDGSYALKAAFAAEVASLEAPADIQRDIVLHHGAITLPAASPCRIRIDTELEKGGTLRLRFGGFEAVLSHGELSCGEHRVTVGTDGRYRLDIVWDGPLAEIIEGGSGRLLPAVSCETGRDTLELSGSGACILTQSLAALSL